MKYTWEELKLTPDPKNGLPIPRSSHSLSVTDDGSTLWLYGGENVARTPVPATQTFWKADLTKGLWKSVVPSDGALFPPPRVGHAQCLHKNQTLYVFGGRSGVDMNETALNDLWAFDLGTEQWTQVEPNSGSIEARSFHSMLCVDDSLFVFGGCGATSGRLADLHRFDLGTRVWESLPSSTLRGRGGPNFCRLGTDSLLVWAGFAGEETNDGAIFDLATKSWRAIMLPEGEVLRPRSVCVAGTLQDGSVVVFGGEVDPSDIGHIGAGGFCQDVLFIQPKPDNGVKFRQDCENAATVSSPGACGWAGGDAVGNSLFVFGGLTGDDTKPTRLGGLWKLTTVKSTRSQVASSSPMKNVMLAVLCAVVFGNDSKVDAFTMPIPHLSQTVYRKRLFPSHLVSPSLLSKPISRALAQLRGGNTDLGILGAIPSWVELLLIDGSVPILPSLLVNVALFTSLSSKLLHMLTPAGFGNALLLGTGLWAALGWKGWLYCVLYLFLGQAVTKIRFAEKQSKGLAEGRGGRRGPENVWGSAATGLICAICASQGPTFFGLDRGLFLLAYIASLATKLADTFASEIGKAYGKTTFLITNLQRVEPGTEGAVSVEGTAAALLGGLLLSLCGYALGFITLPSIAISSLAAFIATNIESLLGATLQGKKGLEWITNEVVNFLNTAIGAALAILMAKVLLGM